MKQITSLYFLLIYTTGLIIPLYPVADYVLHQDYIAKNLCENRDKPNMHCNGKCHLMKQLKKASGENSRPNLPAPTVENFLVHFAPNQAIDFTPAISSFDSPEPLSDSTPLSGHGLTPFHPPCGLM